MTNITPQDIFEESVGTLFWLGQLPIMILTLLAVGAVQTIYPGEAKWMVLLLFFILSVALSTAAMLLRKHQQLAVCLLATSLIGSLLYIHFLVGFTGGSNNSLFLHFYLYMPAVVLMVTQRRRWAEILTDIGVILSYISNYDVGYRWESWKQFSDDNGPFFYSHVAFVVLLLIFLTGVNISLEKKLPRVPQAPDLEHQSIATQ